MEPDDDHFRPSCSFLVPRCTKCSLTRCYCVLRQRIARARVRASRDSWTGVYARRAGNFFSSIVPPARKREKKKEKVCIEPAWRSLESELDRSIGVAMTKRTRVGRTNQTYLTHARTHDTARMIRREIRLVSRLRAH